MRRASAVLALAVLVVCSPAQARQLGPTSCDGFTVATKFRAWAKSVWISERWQRGNPPRRVIDAYRRKLLCAVGPGHRKAMRATWRRTKRIYWRHRHRCLGGRVLRGRVSYFGGGLEASGHYTSEPGIALNIAPGTEGGWNNATTRGWLFKLQPFLVTIAGHRAVLPVTDLGPAGFTWRAIDVTEGGVAALGLTGAFPTDAIGTAQLIPDGCL